MTTASNPNPGTDRPEDEQIHERDCPACDLAAQIVTELAGLWDPNENWWVVSASAIGKVDADTMALQAQRVAAYVLHRRLPGHGAPHQQRRHGGDRS